MAIEVASNVIRLIGHCDHTDVEPLLVALQGSFSPHIDLTEAVHLHGAVLQLLLTLASVEIEGAPADAFIGQWLAPAIMRNQGVVAAFKPRRADFAGGTA